MMACTGSIGDPGSEDSVTPTESDNPLTFECTPGADPSPNDMHRLSKVQYQNTLRALLAPAGADADAIYAAIQASMGLVPNDATDKEHDYVQMDRNVSQSHVDGQYAVGRTFGAQITATPDRMGAFVGGCATDADPSNDAACIEDFITRFGSRVMRRPITADELAFFRDEIYAVNGPIDPRGVVDIVTALLMSPPFAFHLENGGTDVGDREDLYALSGYELASRLSYHFWQTMPDDELWQAAQSGELETDEGYRAQVERVFADPRTRVAVDGFYSQWLRLEAIPDMTEAADQADFQAFAGDDLPGPDFRQNMIEEAKDLLRFYTWQSEGTFDDLFLSDRSFAKTQDMASIYGAPLWTEGEAPPVLPEGQRVGLLTRSALVANNKKTTRPIMKGSFIRKRLLCDKLELPMNMMMMNSNLEIDSELSTRQRVEALTEEDGSLCAGCHTQLNPLGYATESYDALGRFRTEETLYDATGSVLAKVPVDTAAISNVTPNDDRVVRDGIELSELIVDSTKAHACFARHYFRFTTGRIEDFKQDGCVLERSRKAIVEGGSLRAMLLDMALMPEFRLRKRGE